MAFQSTVDLTEMVLRKTLDCSQAITKSIHTPTAEYFYSQRKPAFLNVRSSKSVIGTAVFVAAFNNGFVYGCIVPVLPFSLTERSGVLEKDVQFWVSLLLAVYGVFMAIGTPITGWAIEQESLPKVLLLGVALSLLANILFCLAKGPMVLLLARALQGLSSSVVYTAGPALIGDTVSPKEIVSWIGLVFGGMELGVLVSPLLAGIVYQSLGYLAVFVMVFGVIAFDLLLRLFIIEKKEAMKWRTPNFGHIFFDHQATEEDELESDSDSTDSTGESTQSEDGLRKYPTSPTPPADELSPLFRRTSVESRSWMSQIWAKTTVLLSSRRVTAAVYGTFAQMFLLSCFDAILPQYVKHRFESGPASAGSLFLAISGPCILTPLFGWLSHGCGPRIVALTGFAVATSGFALLGVVNSGNVVDQALLYFFLLIVGIGLTLIVAPSTVSMSQEVEMLAEDQAETFSIAGAYAHACSILCCVTGLATASGPVLAGILFEKTSWHTTQILLAAICTLSSIGAYFHTGGAKHKKRVRFEEA